VSKLRECASSESLKFGDLVLADGYHGLVTAIEHETRVVVFLGNGVVMDVARHEVHRVPLKDGYHGSATNFAEVMRSSHWAIGRPSFDREGIDS